jgi:hypothetical protein
MLSYFTQKDKQGLHVCFLLSRKGHNLLCVIILNTKCFLDGAGVLTLTGFTVAEDNPG